MDASKMVKAHIGMFRQIKEMGFSSEKDFLKNGSQEQKMLVHLTTNKAMEFEPLDQGEYDRLIANSHGYNSVEGFLKYKAEMLEKHPELQY